MTSRRDLLVTIGALPALAQQAPKKPKAFREDEMSLIRDLAETIIPRTDTPGAADAGVEWHIDGALAGRKNELARFRKGLAAAAREQKRGKDLTAILTALQARKDPFFRQLKDLTIDGYYTSKEGLSQELGWHGLTPMAEFEGCTHPEHQLRKKA
ncbi:MAG: gluconate 2-dehydrogenase subunit 3 family protein [Bryobacteraceae bacterium]